MAEFLTTSGVAHNIEEVITGARSQLFLISPYLRLSKTLWERLRDAGQRGVKVILIYGKNELTGDQRDSLLKLNNLSLYYFENLHAKCYFNETIMVITSMNLHEFSEKTNREMGILISKIQDKELFAKAIDEATSILRSSKRDELAKQVTGYKSRPPTKDHAEKATGHGSGLAKRAIQAWDALRKSGAGSPEERDATSKYGFCIRCQAKVNYNPGAPYCKSCYSVWAEFQNPEYAEVICHKCGKPWTHTSMAKPLCRACYESS